MVGIGHAGSVLLEDSSARLHELSRRPGVLAGTGLLRRPSTELPGDVFRQIWAAMPKIRNWLAAAAQAPGMNLRRAAREMVFQHGKAPDCRSIVRDRGRCGDGPAKMGSAGRQRRPVRHGYGERPRLRGTYFAGGPTDDTSPFGHDQP